MSGEAPVAVPSAQAVTGSIELFESGFMADCTVKCGDHAWRLHKIILCTQSEFFRAAFMGNFAEAQAGEVVLEEQDPDIVEFALRFIYSKSLSHISGVFTPEAKDYDSLDAFEVCVPLYALAQFLQMDALCEDIATHLLRFNQSGAHALQRWWRSEGHSERVLSPEFQARFANLARAAYSLPQVGPNATREWSIRTSFLDYIIFRRFLVLRDPSFFDIIGAEAPSLLSRVTLSIDFYGAAPYLVSRRDRCLKCRKNPLFREDGEVNYGTNFWISVNKCYDCRYL
ncbi:BTB/POZ protein [Cercophora newfieldiana]|uniref:BTB/POZ protein n=1 Tax=Cercophora newfieldiana TaxID=92897 RepID=A0AA39YI76_9PEZI|nr:BTB/POZ protein [Cercophora newfieldiana]